MSQIIYESKDLKPFGFVTGLSWSVLSSDAETAKSIPTKIRRQATIVGATKYVLNQVGNNQFLGLFNASPLDTKPPRQLFSIAMVFLNAFKNQDKRAINAVLVMSTAIEDRRIVVVVEGGQISLDVLMKTVDVSNQLQEIKKSGISHAVFSDCADVPNAASLDWPTLETYADKKSQLQTIPQNKGLVLGLVLLIVLGVFGFVYYQKIVVPEKKRAALLAQEALQNQTPQYLQQLTVELKRVGFENASLSNLIQSFKSENYFISGWVLSQTVCDISIKSCEYRYERQGGEIEELIALETDKVHDTNASTRDVAIFRKAMPDLALKELTKAQLLPLDKTTNDLRSRLQRLTNAGATVGTTPTVPWPTQGLDMNKVDKNVVIQQSGVEIRIPYAISDSLFELLPSHLAIHQVALVTSSSGDKAGALLLTLKGASYATR
jgi:hypothetical protein